jgi:tetratricopeptide (TPR) repeat protein
MLHPSTFPILKFAVRQTTAFVGHSFAPEDEEIVDRLTDFFSKLGVACESGKRPEPTSVSDKVRKRIKDAEIFIGIFTRRGEARADGAYATSSWIVEEKAFALAENKRVLIFLEENVEDFGGIQGDLEHIRFKRDNFGEALISAIDYILSITSVNLQSRVEGNNIHITLGDPTSPQDNIAKLRKAKTDRPNDIGVRLGLAALLNQVGDKTAAIRELEHAKTDFPNNPDVYHQLGHVHQENGELDKAILFYERSIELHSANAKFYLCYSKALFEKAKTFDRAAKRKPLLEKSKRFLDQGLLIADPNMQKQLNQHLFLILEALNEFKPGRDSGDA